jgi:hypothetical protein
MKVFERWRRGRGAKATAERRNDVEPDESRVPTSSEATLKAPSGESAEQLIDILRKHGVAAATTRPQGRKVRIGEHEGSELVRAVQMWLVLDSAPEGVSVRCGRRRVRVTRPPEVVAADPVRPAPSPEGVRSDALPPSL